MKNTMIKLAKSSNISNTLSQKGSKVKLPAKPKIK